VIWMYIWRPCSVVGKSKLSQIPCILLFQVHRPGGICTDYLIPSMHASRLWGAQDALVSESLNIIALVPSSTIRYLSQSYEPSRASCAETLGLILDLHNRLIESCTYGVRLSHNCMGKSTFVVPRAPLNLFLNIWMRYTALMR
jgi:hypothetical protein